MEEREGVKRRNRVATIKKHEEKRRKRGNQNEVMRRERGRLEGNEERKKRRSRPKIRKDLGKKGKEEKEGRG